MTRKLVSLLLKKGLTLAVAESCTGGLLSHKLTGIPGASEVFREGIICYSNTSKIKRLGIKKTILEKHGAVSYQVCRLMARNITKPEKTDTGISITGIAGPSGGSRKKPIGLVYIGINIKGRITIYRYNFKGGRRSVQQNSALTAIKLLAKAINSPLLTL